MGMITKLIKTGLAVGAGVTAWQATKKTMQETGGVSSDALLRNFADQAAENIKLVADAIKSKLGFEIEYEVSEKGENGYDYVDGEPVEDKATPPAGDKVNEVFETMKEKAPEVIGKVQDFVEDVRENAPEYKAKAQEFVEDVKEAAKKALDKDEQEDKNDKEQ